jgi:hypothetical protein
LFSWLAMFDAELLLQRFELCALGFGFGCNSLRF